ncbi:UDP-phosphate alpha-N-acetyl-D-fucosaminephosphotransferase [Leucobacter japonicus]|uniref:UDP-phosphate alpha-N-acetyl-D-fucosaminephosphotransferase n=1 Tax=Leucobacter japonicus TaxID=1461259 RepID=UPI0006A7B857|nr:UDP-phosphate alpha-N-acetyl-D-fucosaminephosphotransferase [Leucobacter japonicus]
MTVTAFAWVVGGVAALLSVVLPVAVRPLLVRLGIMDVPNERSSHERPVLRGLGLAVLIAIAIAEAVGVAALVDSEDAFGGWRVLLIVALGTIASGMLGLAEDLRGLSVGLRSVLLLGIALAAAVALLIMAPAGGGVATGSGDGAASFGWAAGVGTLPLWASVLLAIYAVLFISSYINVANFMDGLNGISGFHGVIAGLTFAVAGWFAEMPWLIGAGAALAAGFAGFLPWNLTKPGAFLGDVGSYLLGGAVAITSFAALVSGVPLLATIGPMVICFGDVAVTLVKRVRAGHRWDEPHKEHAYQRIQQRGYSHVQASACTAGATLLTSVLGLASFFTGFGGGVVLLGAGLAVLVVYLLLPRLLPTRN